MPRDSVFTPRVEPLLGGHPLVLYLPDDQPGPLLDVRVDLNTSTDRPYRYVAHYGQPADPSTAVEWRHDDRPTVDGQRCLSVHWTRDGGVVTVGPGARDTAGLELDVPGHHVDLDWNGCNRLIRFVRIARDQAFGRPE